LKEREKKKWVPASLHPVEALRRGGGKERRIIGFDRSRRGGKKEKRKGREKRRSATASRLVCGLLHAAKERKERKTAKPFICVLDQIRYPWERGEKKEGKRKAACTRGTVARQRRKIEKTTLRDPSPILPRQRRRGGKEKGKKSDLPSNRTN